MSADPTANLQVFSPPGSGRSSPAPRSTRQAAEERFRRYAAGVERALALWDTAQQEWADYISFLGRLLKALQSHPPEIPVVAHSTTVALRLAQCLNPALPSGVHQKALEVYGYIFATIGGQKETLARDLHLYFPGLAPVLSFASLSVRPLFLSVFESHILKLDRAALRPALKAIILSLLPGLEDETSEDFERMVAALKSLRNAVQEHSDDAVNAKGNSGSSHFWQCLFLATITNASRRQGALSFLVRHLPKFGPPNRRSSLPKLSGDLSGEAEAAIYPEPGLLIRCFESGLADPQLLIQRGFLDLLVTHLPLDSPVLQQRVGKGDLERLVASAAGVVSRRDMSLNRRLWAWFLGPEPTGPEGGDDVVSPVSEKHGSSGDSAQQAAFFSRYGLEALTSSVLKMINRRSTIPSERARPFRVCLSLMDRWEVGGLIVPEVFLPALRAVQTYSEVSSKDNFDEVMRSASTFFDGVDSGLIWGKLVHLVTSSLQLDAKSHDEAFRDIKLARFVLAKFNLKDEDMVQHHMPLMVLSTLTSLNERFDDGRIRTQDFEAVALALEIADSLIQILPDKALRGDGIAEQHGTVTRSQTLKRIETFYEDSQGSLDMTDPPFETMELGHLILREATQVFVTSIQTGDPTLSTETTSNILGSVIFKTQQLDALDEIDLVEVFDEVITSKGRLTTFPHLSAMTAILAALQTARPSDPYIPAPRFSELVRPLVCKIWEYLSPLKPKFHVEATRCLLYLHSISPTSHLVEAAISSIIVEETTGAQNSTATCGWHFAILWTHIIHETSQQTEKRATIVRRTSGHSVPTPALSRDEFYALLRRPLLLLLDTLVEDASDTAAFIRTWLQDLQSINKVFDIIVAQMQSLSCLVVVVSSTPDLTETSREQRLNRADTKECLYYLNHIANILQRPSSTIWAAIAEAYIPSVAQSSQVVIQEWLLRVCLRTLCLECNPSDAKCDTFIDELYRTSTKIITQILQSPRAIPLRELELEVPLLARLQTAGPYLQTPLLHAVWSALKLRLTRSAQEPSIESKQSNHPSHRGRLSIALTRESDDKEPAPIHPPPQLIDCLKYGFSSPTSRPVLDDWIQFLVDVLPMFADTIFQNLLPLAECLCEQIKITFEHLKLIFKKKDDTSPVSPETTLISLINGLEQILAKAHERLMTQETRVSVAKLPEQPQSFFSNVVSGVFASEMNQTRTPTANSRLTVLLCFQDTVRICFAIWSWGSYGLTEGIQDPSSAASFGYTALRMRNRARRTLEHLFEVEALECLETLIVEWKRAPDSSPETSAILGLLNVLNGSKPRHTIPAIFNAVYSRTDPGALDTDRLSTLTSDLDDVELVTFLVDYTRSLEDDAMDEIWQDCTLFLRDVLTNPLPHRQILPTLLEFTAIIGQKVDNTNFGEQRRMRRELADIFARILTAIFTTRSMGYLQDPSQVADEKTPSTTNSMRAQKRANNVVTILSVIVPKLPAILVDNDRVAKVVSDVSTSVIGPIFRAKSFPENVSQGTLDLLRELTKVSQGNKLLKKDIYDAFNDARFFHTSLPLLMGTWLSILAQWTQSDKERIPELLARLTPPTTAGIMFGVGATSARQEADRKTQLTLKRIALLVLASPEDAFTVNISQILEKVVELMSATPASSPSSVTRADVLVLLRAVILKTSPVHLAALWPVVNGELTAALSSLLPDAANKEHYNNAGIIQTCKLLDELVILDPDDFQLMEWLFITDTIDAVYKPTTSPSIWSLTDEINEVLSLSSSTLPAPLGAHNENDVEEPKRRLFLDPLIEALEAEEGAAVLEMTRSELINRLVRPFLGNLAINSFEARYKGGEPDWQGLWESAVRDAWS
ncbi:similar to cellular morphogenesis regulator DopA [Plenodomus lingam JN3]|uniref:Similar to cellular morphogenesis regulator DopA n=1 Tax=Leptosphaeria maculans (strain JN3 / isolate v23.1.3 / race Av1-4-5-6-7-8) TaxID=985895 RepID=E5A3D2_LEPMJ|nr:similar to cellular morphogenesis regulator DopA [Plenodomus lingam JN3]CBX98145.1 similar to cellular morphogenesis regulator DopA [Plenodomus lingam JN3]